MITAPGRSPVIIEAEYLPADNVEIEAYHYFENPGCNEVCRQPCTIEASIAVRYPVNLAQADNIKAVLETTRQLTYWAVYPNDGRFPKTGWIQGSIFDLADLIHLVDVPENAFDKCAKDLEKSIEEAVSEFEYSKDELINKIFKLLGLTEDPKVKDLSKTKRLKLKRIRTSRIAGDIIANSLIFQERIANTYEHIPTIRACWR